MRNKKLPDGVRLIPIPKEILNKNPMEFLMNPPVFPLLKGEEKRLIVGQLADLTDKDKLVWTDSPLHDIQFKENRVWFMQVSYLGLVVIIEDLDYVREISQARMPQMNSGWHLKLLSNSIDNNPNHPLDFSFESNNPEIKELTDSILAQGKRNITREPDLLNRIWHVLNLR